MASPTAPLGSPPDLPEQVVVVITAPIVAHRCRRTADALKYFLDGFIFQVSSLDGIVEVGGISLVVLGMVDFHRLLDDVGLQRVIGIMKLR